MVETLSASAPGKLLLFGEHAAVYGFPAVGIALDRTLTVEISPEPNWRFRFRGIEASGEHEERYAPFFPHLERVAEEAGLSARCAQIRGCVSVSTEIPVAGGFGSSAALCTALARILAPPDAEPKMLWRVSHRLETYFHGTASGVDTGLTVLGGTLAFRFGSERELPTGVPISLPETAIIYGTIPRAASTRELVGRVRSRLEEKPRSTRRLLKRLGTIADSVASMRIRTAEGFGRLAIEAHAHLRRLGVSSETLDLILDRAERAGALGGKLSGAGGGGAFYLVCSSFEQAKRVHETIETMLKQIGGGSPAILQIKPAS